MANCKYCGKEMQVSFRQKVFCSKECSKAYYNRKGRINKECQICGNELTGKQRSYCSQKCANKAKRIQLYEYHKDQYKKPKAEATPKKSGRRKKTDPIAEINAKARAEGLSYGQYVGKYGL